MDARRSLMAWGVAAAVAVAAGGCSRSKDIARENESLRLQIIELGKQIEQLQRRNAELLAELRQTITLPDAVPEGVRAAIPHPAEITIGRLSHARRDGPETPPHLLVVYLKPVDGMGRFVQLVGDVALSAAIVPPDGQAATIGSASLDPVGLRAAYRSSLMGTHYTVEIPIEGRVGADDNDCVVAVEFVDTRTGRVLKDHRVINLWR